MVQPAKRSLRLSVGDGGRGTAKRFRSDPPRQASIVAAAPPPDKDDELIAHLEEGRAADDVRLSILRYFWAEIGSNVASGEAATVLKFTSRYRSLHPAKKLRLLEVTSRDEIASDLLGGHFKTMGADLQIELLRLSPYHKATMASYILANQFAAIGADLRLRFLDTAPFATLADLLEHRIDLLTVSEALAAARNLHERQYERLRARVADQIWHHRDQCQLDDLVQLSQLVLPKLGQDIVAEVKQRLVQPLPPSRRPLSPASDTSCESVPFMRPQGVVDASAGARHAADRGALAPSVAPLSTLALLFPTGMAECFHKDANGRRPIGSGPLVPVPTLPIDQHDGVGASRADAADSSDANWFRVEVQVDWTAAAFGFFQVVQCRSLGQYSEAVVTITDEKGQRFELGALDDDSPTLEVQWPLPGLGTPTSFTMSAIVRASFVDEESDSDSDDCVCRANKARSSPSLCRSSSGSDLSEGPVTPSFTGIMTPMREPSTNAVFDTLNCLVALSQMTTSERTRILLAYRNPHVKTLIDLLVDKARVGAGSSGKPDALLFLRYFHSCRGAILTAND